MTTCLSDRRRAVIFDIGGVLLNFDLPRLVSRAAQGNPDSTAVLLGLREKDSLRQVESGFMTGEAYFETFIRPVVPSWTFRDLIDGWKSIFSENEEGLGLLACARAGGASVFFLSNLADYNRIAIDELFPDFLGRSDKSFLSYEMGCIKPDPTIFMRVMETIGARAEQCMFLDDTAGHVESARRLGMRGMVFEGGRGARMKKELADWLSGNEA